MIPRYDSKMAASAFSKSVVSTPTLAKLTKTKQRQWRGRIVGFSIGVVTACNHVARAGTPKARPGQRCNCPKEVAVAAVAGAVSPVAITLAAIRPFRPALPPNAALPLPPSPPIPAIWVAD
jgi:hypothetical protein